MWRLSNVNALQSAVAVQHKALRQDAKKPLISCEISGFGIWLRGQDLNL
jgi:hypothetical protein